MTPALLDSEAIRSLTEVGFLAAARREVRRAERIFGALELARPQAVFAYVGLASAYLNAGRPDEAVAVLDRGLRVADAQVRGELHAFRGLALHAAGRNAESLRALQRAGDIPLARRMLGQQEAQIEGI